jgi:hypothetical protein
MMGVPMKIKIVKKAERPESMYCPFMIDIPPDGNK